MNILNPTSGFPTWGSDKDTGNLQEIQPWGPARFDYRTSRGPGIPVLESTNKILTTPRPRGIVTPQETETKLLASVGERPEEV